MIIGKNLGFDLNKNRALCSQLNQYKEGYSPFDFPVEYGFDEPTNWWNIINTRPQPNSLPLIALHLFAICPNLASCERGFSNLGWLTNKRRLQLGIENLESMCKMITYWKSNARKELSFFGQETQESKLKDAELNQIITEALAEPDENIDDDFEDNLIRRTTSGEIIPDDIVTVLIEDIWIEKTVDLSDQLILKDIGEIPEDSTEDLTDIECEKIQDNEENKNPSDNNNEKGILDYNIDDLLEEFIHK